MESFESDVRSWGIGDLTRGKENLRAIRALGVPADLMRFLSNQLGELLPHSGDPDRVLNNLERFLTASRNPAGRVAMFERDREVLPTLLRIFSVSQYLADLLIQDPESFELVRLTGGQPIARETLVDEIRAEVLRAADEASAARLLRRFHQRETLRIAYGDFVAEQPLERVTEQISFLADAILEGAVEFTLQRVSNPRGRPTTVTGAPARFVVLAMGKLGGTELNYSSDLDLMFLTDPSPAAGGAGGGTSRGISGQEYFERVARGIIKLLTDATQAGPLYRVDLRLRPWGKEGPLVCDTATALRYYDLIGRTWERQAFVKARAVAGHLDLGRDFLKTLEPWIYRRFLSRADISGIRALKRKLERMAIEAGEDQRNIKTGHGGIRDIEFAIQFLQLLNGGDLPGLRTGNTLRAIAALEQAHCLTAQEASLLTDSYVYLRRVEHRLQIMFNLQSHTIPPDGPQRDRLAVQLGCRTPQGGPDRDRFAKELGERQGRNRRILDHLLHDAFADEEIPAPETDLVLDPEPEPKHAREVLQVYGFQDCDRALVQLQALANERIPFLSPRRCRHFLAAIAPNLLREIAKTPDPDGTLVSLVQVSDSLGGKRVLWELFSSTPAALTLFVRLCATSPYLTGILTSNPGMIDELLDALILNRLPSHEELAATAHELCKRAEDLGPILMSFKNSVHLSIGVRDILGKEDIRQSHRALADTAEACLGEVIERERQRLTQRYGEPMGAEGRTSELVVLGVGKLGGREPNYHSDLDLIFVYEEDGVTQVSTRGRESTTNAHFYNQLAQRVIQFMNQRTAWGRLYEVDARLRPSGRSGVLAVPVQQLLDYFALEGGTGELWERLALIKGRPVYGTLHARNAVQHAVHRILREVDWKPEFATEIRSMRMKLEANASERNIKRSAGGTIDVEFIAQLLQLRYASSNAKILVPGTLDALEQLRAAGHLTDDRARRLSEGYHFLRRVESGLRLMNTSARHDLPNEASEFRRLAYLLGDATAEGIADRCESIRQTNRQLFNEILDECGA